MSLNGPSPFALPILRTLSRRPATALQLVRATGLDTRTVRAQIAALRRDLAVRRAGFMAPGRRAGAQAVYRLEIEAV